MGDPFTPRAPSSNARTSEARNSAFCSMRKWLKEPGPATFGPASSAGQLLPPQTLRSRLQNAERGLTPPKTLVASINSQPLDPDRKSDTHASDETLAGVENSLVQRSKSPVDLDAPYPTPLHVIAAVVDSSLATGSKNKLQKHIWELSDLDAESDRFEKENKFREASSCPNESDIASRDGHIIKALTSESAPPPVESWSVSGWLGTAIGGPIIGPEAGLNTPEGIRCDIDTFTGKLLPAIQYPETHKDQIKGEAMGEKDIAWRQANMTSTLQISRELIAREKLAQQGRAQFQAEEAVFIARKKLTQQGRAQFRVEEPIPLPQEDPWPKAKCLIRPAVPNDFDQIALIINSETQKPRPRVVQSEVATPELVSYIFHHCERHHRPFIVAEATDDEAIERSKWPGGDDEYEEYIRFKKSQRSTKPAGVLGFAYITEWHVGFLLSTTCSGSKYFGQIKMLVHPDHQNKKIGSALLDRILATTAIYHRSLIDYKWEDQGVDTVIYSVPAARNKRKYARLYLETPFRKNDSDKEWISKWLQKFEFAQMACIPEALQTDRKAESESLDLVLWAYEARPVAEIWD